LITIVETPIFQRDAAKYLTPNQVDAIHALIVRNPLIGQQDALQVNSLSFEWSKNPSIILEYAISLEPNLTIFLLAVHLSGEALGDPGLWKSSRETLKNIGIGIAIREVGKWVFEKLKDFWHF
jgi:hypothetical protein